MSCHNPMDRDSSDPYSRAEQDTKVQGPLLALVLAEHPIQLAFSDLVQELVADPADFGERDAVERAVRDLAGVGLLRRRDIFVLPTRAALYFERLESGRDRRH